MFVPGTPGLELKGVNQAEAIEEMVHRKLRALEDGGRRAEEAAPEVVGERPLDAARRFIENGAW